MSTTDCSDDARMRRETVRMPGDLRADVQRLVDEGEFASKSELIRTAVRELLEDQDA